MSTEFMLHKNGDKEVTIVESGAKFDLDLYGYREDMALSDEIPACYGPQHMSAEDALNMAAKIMYAVWCSYPDKADAMAARLAGDIPNELFQPTTCQPTEREIQQPEHPVMDILPNACRPIERGASPAKDRMYRAGVIPYKVEVLNDVGDSIVYTVHATNALDARCMAFVLDGGCPLGLKNWDDGHIDLALAHTKVVE